MSQVLSLEQTTADGEQPRLPKARLHLSDSGSRLFDDESVAVPSAWHRWPCFCHFYRTTGSAGIKAMYKSIVTVRALNTDTQVIW